MLKIATIGSHSALQILKGAKDEGFSTILISTQKQAKIYTELFPIADEVITLDSYTNFFDVEDYLISQEAVIVPHGSFVAYLDQAKHDLMRVKYFGNKDILKWESNRQKQMQWLQQAGLHLPKIFTDYREVDRPVIVKLYGAGGGQGYFVVTSKEQLEQEVAKRQLDLSQVLMQEYILGCPVYIHYFYSPILNRLEILSLDRRYETNVDGLGRLNHQTQAILQPEPSFVVIGNSPLVIRESLLADLYDMGQRVVAVSKEICPPRGLYGPFCLETIVTPEQKFYVIEISARIVAGTNLFIQGSPYAELLFSEPMSTGRRIARELKLALAANRLEEVV